MKTTTSVLAVLLLLSSFARSGEDNSLTESDRASGWKLLFDGKTSTGWQSLGGGPFPEAGWSVKEGALHLEKASKTPDIVTTSKYLNFELRWDWKISPVGNSGVKYQLPDPTKNIGLEYQILDDANHPDGVKNGALHQTAGLYDLISPAAERKVNPVGEWNSSRIVVDGNHVEHWINGVRTVSYELESPEFRKSIAGSKYKKIQGFGNKAASPILLQNHGDEVFFRNIKLRELPVTKPVH
jgi:hypothetical protein